MTRFLPVLLVLLMAAPVRAEVTTKPVEYKQGGTSFEGILFADSLHTGKRPGVLLAHDHGASSVQAKAKALVLARLGYIVLSADLFGKGYLPKDATDAAAKLRFTGPERKQIRERASAALTALERVSQVDPKRIAAVGYGVGGTALLELARAKAELEGVVCVHGELAPSDEGKSVGASLLVLIGTEDPKVSLADVAAFEDEMRKGGVDWQLVRYGGVAGDFTNPQAGKNLKSGRAYDADADQRAADAIRLFLAESFQPPAKAAPPAKAVAAPKGVPEKALKVLEYVDKHHEAMAGYEGGRNFGNFERRLPMSDKTGGRVKYQEWDVNPLRPGVNRGTERLITGSDGTAYFTDDHYATFKKIR